MPSVCRHSATRACFAPGVCWAPRTPCKARGIYSGRALPLACWRGAWQGLGLHRRRQRQPRKQYVPHQHFKCKRTHLQGTILALTDAQTAKNCVSSISRPYVHLLKNNIAAAIPRRALVAPLLLPAPTYSQHTQTRARVVCEGGACAILCTEARLRALRRRSRQMCSRLCGDPRSCLFSQWPAKNVATGRATRRAG
jgi:hypothetical protein